MVTPPHLSRRRQRRFASAVLSGIWLSFALTGCLDSGEAERSTAPPLMAEPPLRLEPERATELLDPAQPGAAEPRALKARVQELAAWVEQNQGKLSVSVTELGGAELAAQNPDQALNPASNMKVVTAAAALDLLGPDFTFRTSILGDLRGSRAKQLVLRGNGDPALGMATLWRLGSTLVQLGLREVEGDILVDQSRFDDQYVPPAFEQQPNEWAYFRAPVSAVALDGNTVTLNVVPTKAGEAAKVWFEPPGFVQLRGNVSTREKGKGQAVGLKLTPEAGVLGAQLSGHLAEGLPRQRFVRRVDDPRLFPGYALAHVLKQLGVELKGSVKSGGAREKNELVYLTSDPLADLVKRLGKQSDNFYAEMLFKALAAQHEPGKPSSFKAGAERVNHWLNTSLPKGVGERAAKSSVIKNGSGLFDANRLSARTLTDVLSYAYQTPRLGHEFMAHLSIGGVDGTLRSRFSSHRDARNIRAKTGTLARAVSLSGYVLRKEQPPYTFAILVEGIGDLNAVRQRMDRVVEALAAAN